MEIFSSHIFTFFTQKHNGKFGVDMIHILLWYYSSGLAHLGLNVAQCDFYLILTHDIESKMLK